MNETSEGLSQQTTTTPVGAEPEQVHAEGIDLESSVTSIEGLTLQEQAATDYLKELIARGEINDPELLAQYRDIAAVGTQLDKNTMTYRLAGETEDNSPHDATHVNFKQLQHLETLAQDKQKYPDAETHFNNTVKYFAAKVTGSNGKTYNLNYEEYKKWIREGRTQGIGLFIGDLDTDKTKFSHTDAIPYEQKPSTATAEQEDPKEVRKKEIVGEMRALVDGIREIKDAHKEGVHFFGEKDGAGRPYQQEAMVAWMRNFYPEIFSGVEITDGVLLQMQHRDNSRRLFVRDQILQDPSLTEELRGQLESDQSQDKAEQKFLESLDEVKSRDQLYESLDLASTFKDPEVQKRFLEIEKNVETYKDKVGPLVDEKLKEITNEKIKGVLKGSALAAAFILFLIGSQLLQGEGQPEPA